MVKELRIERWMAFNVNSIGAQQDPFPLSFSSTVADGVYSVVATAARAVELVDLLAAHAQDYAVVLNVGTNSFLEGDAPQWPLGRIAREQGVDAAVHDIRWAASRCISDDLLVVPWMEMPKFLDDWSPYQIEVFDVAALLTSAGTDELALAVNTHDMTTPVLPAVPGAQVYYDGHDDCYVYVETTAPDLPAQLLARLLALKAASALLGQDAEFVTVAEPPADLVADLMRCSDRWVGEVVQVTSASVTIALGNATEQWRLSDPLPDLMAYQIVLDLESLTWSKVC